MCDISDTFIYLWRYLLGEQALIRNAQIDASRITVDVRGNKVILHGTVRSEAENIIWAMPGVNEVDNRLVIIPYET